MSSSCSVGIEVLAEIAEMKRTYAAILTRIGKMKLQSVGARGVKAGWSCTTLNCTHTHLQPTYRSNQMTILPQMVHPARQSRV